MSQDEINEKKEKDKKFRDSENAGRAEYVQGQLTRASTVEQRKATGSEGTVVKREKGAFEKQFDEGHFYFLEDFLALHCAGQKFKSFKAKVKAVEKLGKTVSQDKFNRYGVNVSVLPDKAAYKYQSGDAETFKKVKSDELSDEEEADDYLDMQINDGLAQQEVASLALEDAGSDDDGRGDNEDSQSDASCEANVKSIVTHSQSGSRAGSARSVRSAGGPAMSPRSSPNSSRASSPDCRGRSMGAPTMTPNKTQPRAPKFAAARPGFRVKGQLLPLNLLRAPSSASRAPSSNRSQQAENDLFYDEHDHETQAQPQNQSQPQQAEVKKGGRKKIVQSLEEAQEAFDEYVTDFTPENLYGLKYKTRDVTGAVDRLRKIGNKVACMEGDNAADLAAKIVAFADKVRPLYDVMETLRSKPADFLKNV